MESKRRKCINDPDSFCFICGSYTLQKQRRPVNDFAKKLYYSYFNLKLGDQDKEWAPNFVCETYLANLRGWSKGKRKSLSFGIPMIWREPKDHVTDYYFCLTKTEGFNAKNKSKIIYPNLPSAIRPVAYCDEIPIPIYKESNPDEEITDKSDKEMLDNEHQDKDYAEELISEKFSQNGLNDLVRDLALSKESSELLASRLAEKNLLHRDVRITVYRNRHNKLLQYFSKHDEFAFCNNIESLLNEMGVENYSPDDWRLFIDSSKHSLICVLLDNGNEFGSIPIAHSTKAKETYESVKSVLHLISYDHHKWIICVDLKMVCFLLGQQSGFTKYPCFLCLWDSRARSQHWEKREWPITEQMDVGEKNIINEPLVDRNKIIFSPLHIKLGLMKQFVKALNKEGNCFEYICRTFPGLSNEKLKAGIFDGPQIRKLLKDTNFVNSMNSVEAATWNAFTEVVNKFLGNVKHTNYVQIVHSFIQSFHALGCNMSIKVHFLFSHLEKFPENLSDVSDEQGERFHQDIKTMEEQYQGRWDEVMMADFCWSLKRDCSDTRHRRKSDKRKFIPQ